MRRYLPFVIIAAALIIALGSVALMLRSAKTDTSTAPLPDSSPSSSQVAVMPRTAVTLEEYGDYQCPPCGSLHPELKKLKSEFGDRIRFAFHHFPLTQIHKHALEASQAAAAAGLQGRFWEMHDLLYQNQSVWSEAPDLRPIVINFARQIGLDVDRFVKDMDGAQVAAIISADVKRGQSLGVNGTPTLFLDGLMVKENTSIDDLRKYINERLNGRK